ncbi:hypothetical protein E2C01_055275 [Portunus trituberculatus]|uniref:Uncharacterized protein n=1 Tax=Portunus trituberculatus TaxID=210409 RepID=A0A5B7GUE1_PORTR|nr:hypothetical protein [Portunus trituberculatus]
MYRVIIVHLSYVPDRVIRKRPPGFLVPYFLSFYSPPRLCSSQHASAHLSGMLGRTELPMGVWGREGRKGERVVDILHQPFRPRLICLHHFTTTTTTTTTSSSSSSSSSSQSLLSHTRPVDVVVVVVVVMVMVALHSNLEADQLTQIVKAVKRSLLLT